ncbi:hypothetical protein Tsp_02295 [Trichinella spiralis]|uniref:hypothetical protein n=1 Tax=Trichinella spiralis TaxID=6334 RepID=UPI0001EFCCAB|nr:hypothetical protein Tsp_02295 [Trichinella spiralis]
MKISNNIIQLLVEILDAENKMFPYVDSAVNKIHFSLIKFNLPCMIAAFVIFNFSLKEII